MRVLCSVSRKQRVGCQGSLPFTLKSVQAPPLLACGVKDPKALPLCQPVWMHSAWHGPLVGPRSRRVRGSTVTFGRLLPNHVLFLKGVTESGYCGTCCPSGITHISPKSPNHPKRQMVPWQALFTQNVLRFDCKYLCNALYVSLNSEHKYLNTKL